MKKILKYFGLPLLVFSLLLLPALSVKAEGTVSVTVNSTSTNTVDVSWPAAPAVATGQTFDGYYVGIGTNPTEANNDCETLGHKTTDTKYQFSNCPSGTGLVVVVKYGVLDDKGARLPLVDYYKNATAVTVPATPENVRSTFWSLGTDELVVEWDHTGNCSYFEIVVTDSDGDAETYTRKEKKLELDTEDTKYFLIKVRAVTEANGITKESPFTENFRPFSQPTIKESRNGYKVAVKNKKLVVEWWEEKYSQGYEVWVATKKNGPYTKVKTINKNTTEKATIKKYNGKAFKPKGQYWITVTAFRKSPSNKIQRTSASYVIYYNKGETFQTIVEKVNLKK